MTEEQDRLISALYVQMYDRLMTYARLAEKDESLAEEAVQDTFHIACQNPEKLCGSPNPEGWLVLTMRYAIRNARRRRAAKAAAENSLLEQVREDAFTEDQIRLKLLYGDVADTEEFALMTEMAVEGWTHQEMAQKRNITVDACKKRVQRAKEFLRRKLQPDVTK